MIPHDPKSPDFTLGGLESLYFSELRAHAKFWNFVQVSSSLLSFTLSKMSNWMSYWVSHWMSNWMTNWDRWLCWQSLASQPKRVSILSYTAKNWHSFGLRCKAVRVPSWSEVNTHWLVGVGLSRFGHTSNMLTESGLDLPPCAANIQGPPSCAHCPLSLVQVMQ